MIKKQNMRVKAKGWDLKAWCYDYTTPTIPEPETLWGDPITRCPKCKAKGWIRDWTSPFTKDRFVEWVHEDAPIRDKRGRIIDRVARIACLIKRIDKRGKEKRFC